MGLALRWMIWLGLAIAPWGNSPVLAQGTCGPQNTQRRDGVQVIGADPALPYTIAVTPADAATLEQVRQCVPDAFEAIAPMGNYIHGGQAASLEAAEALAQTLRQRNLQVCVIHRRS